MTRNNPVLLVGEVGYETDTGKTKRGNGIAPWTLLPYEVSSATVADAITAQATLTTKAVADAIAAQAASDAATYVAFKNFDGTPVTGKHVVITLTADGTDIDNIQVVTP